ncbi:MAG: alpha-ketoacid dehydrogenase subunit beta [Dehalococcoidia bacterium]|nr:MAG: alpha-ketoacid dehydrogenase subunit beta [Dehalococcoidia bacterium]
MNVVREISTIQAIHEAVAEEMRRDERVYLIGEAVGPGGLTVTRSPAEIFKEFGESRVRETGIIEPTLAASATGAALSGLRPIVDFSFADFMFPAWSEIYQAGLWRAGHGAAEDMKIPLVYMGGIIGYSGGGFSHSRAPIGNIWHGPGLKLVIATTPYDAKGLLKTAIRDDNPVVFLVHRLHYPVKGPVPEEECLIPFGEAVVRKEGKDVTVVADGYQVTLSLEAAEDLAREGISVEVIDPRTLEPLDIDTILASVEKTGRLVVVDEDYIRCGPHAEIAFQVQERSFKSLKAPVQRVGNLNMPIPTAKILRDAALPTREKIIAAVKKTIKNIT